MLLVRYLTFLRAHNNQYWFSDNPGARTLGGASFTDPVNMTVEACINFCNAQDFIFAGAEFAQECCGFSSFSFLSKST